MKKNRITLVNIISGLLLQLVTIISGFIVPKVILSYFGSTVNGLVSSINQFLSYITLVEGGVTGVISANLYYPLITGNNLKLGEVVVTANKFFKQVGIIFLGYAVLLAFIYPIVFSAEFGYFYTWSFVLILAIGLFIQYMFSLTLKTLLSADKKLYIVNFTQIAISIINIILVFVSVRIYPSIHVLKFITGGTYILQPIIFKHFTKKYYSIVWKGNPDNSLIKERWNGFAINIAAFVHNCTDISLLTAFSTLETVSIYSVYGLVTGGLKQLIVSITAGINPTIGQAYAKGNLDELNSKLDLYEYIVFVLVCFTFGMAGLLITPFVMIYTKGISDANYYQPLFGILLILSEALYLIKFPHLNLAYAANKFKEITSAAYIEATLNLVLSIILVGKLDLLGVTIGTLVAMIYRMAFQVYYTSRIIEGRKQSVFYKKFILFFSVTVVGMVACFIFLPIRDYTVYIWIKRGVEYFVLLGFLYICLSITSFRKELIYFIKYIKK